MYSPLHKITTKVIEADKEKIDLVVELYLPTNVNGSRNFQIQNIFIECLQNILQ